MEIEAKYVVPDPGAARQLRALERIAEFSLSAPTRFIVRDTYFDTPENDLIRTRHVLRFRRRSDGLSFLTFKAPTQKNAAIHRRPETEVELARERTPRVLKLNALPAQIKKLVAPLVHADSLHPLFSITQTRDFKTVYHKRRVIAELSLDHVRFRAGQRKHAFYELEIELKKTGRENQLQEIAKWLDREYNLSPQPESKFARGLQFVRGN
jgi:inorganic triphosphatase YgiF